MCLLIFLLIVLATFMSIYVELENEEENNLLKNNNCKDCDECDKKTCNL